MAISTYSELQASIADWIERTDLTARIPDFIALCESDLNAEFNVRTLVTDAALTGTIGSRLITLPSGYRDCTALWRVYDSGRDELQFVLPEQLVVTTNTGNPVYWTIDGSSIAFEYPLDAAYSYVLRKVGGLALSDAAPTNLILTNYPNTYLFGAMKYAGIFLRDQEMVATAAALYREALEQAKGRENTAGRNAVLRTNVPGNNKGGFNIFRGF